METELLKARIEELEEELAKTQFFISCLYAGGLDNWEWFGESLEDYNRRYPNG